MFQISYKEKFCGCDHTGEREGKCMAIKWVINCVLWNDAMASHLYLFDTPDIINLLSYFQQLVHTVQSKLLS